MAVMRCPNCGKPNPDFLEVCQYCDARLHPEAPGAPGAPSSAEDTLIRPPAPPASEPEPDAARDAEPLDWMSRLRRMQSGEAPPAARTQADEPDWMWTGAPSEDPKTKSATPTPPAAQDSSVELPDWLRDLDKPIDLAPDKPLTTEKPQAPAASAPASLAAPTSPATPPAAPSAPITNYHLPITAPQPAKPRTPPAPPTPPAPVEPSPFEPAASDETIPPRSRRKMTDWLNRLQELPPPSGPTEPEQAIAANTDIDLPDWLKAVAADAASPGGSEPAIEAATQSQTPPPAAPTPEEDLPDWLRALRSKSEPPTPVPGTGALQSRPPAGASSQAAQRNQALPENVRPPAPIDTVVSRPAARPLESASDDMPDWLKDILSVHAQDTAAKAPAAPVAADEKAAGSAAQVPLAGPAPAAAQTPPPAAQAAPAAPQVADTQVAPAAPQAPTTPAATPTAAVTRSLADAPPTTLEAATFEAAAPAESIQPGSTANTQTLVTPPPGIGDAPASPARRGKRMTDWLGSVPPPAPGTEPVADELPDWLKTLSAETAAKEALAQRPSATAPAEALPDWLNASAPAAGAPAQSAEPAATAPAKAAPEPAVPVTDYHPLPPATAGQQAAPVTPSHDLPDWLTAITQEQPVDAAAATVAPATTAPAASEASVAATAAASTTAAAATTPEPAALAAMADTPAAPVTNDRLPISAGQQAAPVTPSDDLPDWLKAITQASATAAASATAEAAAIAPATAAVTSGGAEAEVTFVPSQAISPAVEATAAETPVVTTPVSAEPPVREPGTTAPVQEPGATAATAPQAPPATDATLPPWLQGAGIGPMPDLPELDEKTLAWLSEDQKTEAAPGPAGVDLSAAKSPPEAPAWLEDLAAATAASGPAATPEISPTPEAELPEWLRALRGQSGEEETAPEAMPDWLRALRALPPGAQAGGAARPATQPLPGVTASTAPTTVATTPPGAPTTTAVPTTASSGLEQASLPAWLAAMRPVDIEQPAVTEADSYQETLGVLAGMRGVLRAEPAVAQLHKAATPVLKLLVSETNTAHANLLTELLRTETVVQPTRRRRERVSVLVERWVVFLVLLVALVLAQFQAQLPLPALFAPPSPNLPPAAAAVYSLIERLPIDKPALVAFDYDAAQAGELDPGAQAVIAHLTHHGVPVVGVSLRLTGPAVAEQVLSKTASGGYVNLGYISGGPVGLLQFAADPRSAFNSDFSGSNTIWSVSPIISNVHSLTDFGLIVLVSGAPESTRAWIEQAQLFAAGVPTVAVISAGAEPMVRPYYDDPSANSLVTGHLPLKGLIVGLGGAAAYERATYSPAAATSLWPAMGGGLLAAAAIIVFGNLIFAVLGALRRRKA